MDKIKILYIFNRITNDGINSFVSEVYENINQDIFQIDFCVRSIDKDCKYLQIFSTSNSQIFEYEKEVTNKFLSIKNEYKVIKEGNYDIVHIHGTGSIKTQVLNSILCRIAGMKNIILHSHNSSMGTSKKITRFNMVIFKLLKPLLKLSVTNFFACSEDAAKWMFPKSIVAKKNYSVINNGIDKSKFYFDDKIRENMRNKLELNDKLVIGHIGRFLYQKNHDFLIDIFDEINKINKNAVLLLIGEGNLENQIKVKVEKLGLKNKVYFLGVRNDINDLLNAMDIFVLPSFFEGLGIVTIESQATNLYTVVSDNIPKEADISSNIDYLDLNLESKEWAERILKGYNKHIRVKNNDFISKNEFDIVQVVKKIEEYYIKIMENTYEKNKSL